MKYAHDMKLLRNIKHLERVNIDLDSPLIRKACHNLGISIKDCEKKTLDSFK